MFSCPGPIATASRVVYQASMPLKDPNARRAYQRDYIRRTAEKHRENSREAMRRWRANHPDVRLARDRSYRARNPEKKKVWDARYRAAHPDIYLAISRRRRGRAAGAAGSFTAAEWKALVVRSGGRCGYCGITAKLEADHRVPLCRGGANGISNIIPACGPCNRRKHDRTDAEFRALLAAEKKSRPLYNRVSRAG